LGWILDPLASPIHPDHQNLSAAEKGWCAARVAAYRRAMAATTSVPSLATAQARRVDLNDDAQCAAV
jgi:hypothetical protein